MKTKYNIGDSVMIRGTVRRIAISREGEIFYDVENESESIGQYGYNCVKESEIVRMEESKNDSVH